jgi:hypothetical protein
LNSGAAPQFGHIPGLSRTCNFAAAAKEGLAMQLVLSEGVRGLSMIVDLALDRIIVPLAVVVALLGACIIGIQLAEMLAPAHLPYQL